MSLYDRRDLIKTAGSFAAAFSFPSASSQAAPAATGSAQTLFDVRRFGAQGTGKVLDTDAVNRAIAAAAEAGGGTVYFPAGTYLCFSIRLKSNVSLYLDQGCTILGGQSPGKGEATANSAECMIQPSPARHG